jgi:hypothetical protein
MTQVEISDGVVDTLKEIAHLRGLDGPGAALEEAIGLERQIAKTLSIGSRVLIAVNGNKGPLVQIDLSKRA